MEVKQKHRQREGGHEGKDVWTHQEPKQLCLASPPTLLSQGNHKVVSESSPQPSITLMILGIPVSGEQRFSLSLLRKRVATGGKRDSIF